MKYDRREIPRGDSPAHHRPARQTKRCQPTRRGGLAHRDWRRGLRFSRSTAATETPASLRALHINCFIVRFFSLAVVAIASIVLARTRSVMVVAGSPSGGRDRGTPLGSMPPNTKRRFFGGFTTSELGNSYKNLAQKNGAPPPLPWTSQNFH